MAFAQEELSRLIIKIVGDTQELKKEVDKGKGVISGFANDIKKVLAGIGFALIIKKIVDLTKQSIDLMDTMSKTAQKIGETTESLSALAYAADLSDISLGNLTVGLRTLARNMYDAQNGTGEAKEAFKDLRIEVERSDGRLKTASEILVEIADKMSSLDDDTKKAALAQRIFGRSGTDLIPLLNQGAEGIKKLTDEAHRFGAVIDTEAGKQAEDFNDNLKRLQYAFRGLFNQLAIDILPTLLDISEAIVTLTKETDNLDTGLSTLSFTLKGIASAGIGVYTSFQTISKAWAAMLNMWFEWETRGFGAIKDIISYAKIAKEDIEDLWLKMGNAIDRIWNPLERIKKEAKDSGAALGNDLKKGTEGASKALDEMKKVLDAIAEKTMSLRIETIALIDPLIASSLELDNWINTTTEAVQGNEELKEKIQELKNAFWELQETTARIDLGKTIEKLENTKHIENSKNALLQLQIQYRDNQISAEEYYNKVISISKDAYDRETEAIQRNIDIKKQQYDALVQEMIKKGESIEITAQMRKTEAEWAELQEQLITKKSEWTNKEIALLHAKTDAMEANKEKQLETTNAILGDMSTLATGIYNLSGGKMKAFFYLSRAIAFAQAIIDAYVAANKVLGQTGIFGFSAYNQVLSLGLANAALIAAQTIQGMEKGGRVNGGSGTRDDVPIMATRGEYMMDVSTVKHYGLDFMEALRRHIIPKGIFSLSGSLRPQMVYGAAATGGMIAGSNNMTINIPVSVENPRFAAKLREGIENTVISILRDHT